jgi:biotin operon repressor
MTFIEQLRLMQRIDILIARKGTGTPKDLSSILGISRSSVFNYLDNLRQLGADIDYCDFRKSYFYVDNKRPRFPVFSKADSENFQGGKIDFDFFSYSPEFLDWGGSPLSQVQRQQEALSAGDCNLLWL